MNHVCPHDDHQRTDPALRPRRYAWALALLWVLGALWLPLGAQGCGKSSSARFSSGGPTNFRVENTTAKTLNVYIDGLEVGGVIPNATAPFYVDPGFREVGFRERGSSLIESQGIYDFTSDGLLRLTYDPTITHNLRVRNNSVNTIEVIVGFNSFGDVLPTTSHDFFVSTGRRDLFLRRAGESTAFYFGTFNFNTTTAVDVQFP